MFLLLSNNFVSLFEHCSLVLIKDVHEAQQLFTYEWNGRILYAGSIGSHVDAVEIAQNKSCSLERIVS